jgi:uncharacterized protein with FMN-binding domain
MVKTSLRLLAIILVIVGISILAARPAWGGSTAVAVFLLAVAGAAGALTLWPLSENRAVERSGAGQKISNGLVVLSSAAILSVYAAGYYRTGSAAARFAAQTSRKRTAAPIAASHVAPKAATPAIAETPPLNRPAPPPPAPAPQVRSAHRRASSTAVTHVASKPMEESPAKVTAPSIVKAIPEPEAEPVAATTSQDQPAEPATPANETTQVRYKDGSYLGWGTCPHGEMQVHVVVQGGRIVSAEIVQCLTRYTCTWIGDLTGKVVRQQGPVVDVVSGASESSNAYHDAVAEALSQAHE